MPAEYMACVASETKGGKPHAEAQKICAIAYYKKHGKTPEQAAKEEHKKSDSMEIPEIFKMYAPFSKIDEEKHMVYGYATTASLDSQDEVVDLDASFEAVDEWKAWANIKEMHRPETAVGVAPIIEKHVGVGVYIGAKIVDDQAWRKCVEKVYKGFSIGGKVIKRDEKNSKRITKYQLREVSLVDRPANPDSVFMVAKRDDTIASAKEAVVGGDSMEKNEALSNPVAGEATGTPPKAEVEAVVVKQDAPKVEVPAQPEMVTISKADMEAFQKLQSQLKDMEKVLADRKEQDVVADAIMKAVEKLEPKIKKVHEEVQTTEKSEAQKTEEAKTRLRKMSIGELTQQMFKSVSSAPIKEKED
jgi:phage head maturation protease